MFNITEPLPPIILTTKDLMALDILLMMEPIGENKNENYISEYLQRELSRADVVSEKNLPDNIVRMYSTITYSTNMIDEERRLTLVYPKEADIDAGKVSVITPIGAALIGMAVGNSITYYTPNGGKQTLTVIAVTPPSDNHDHSNETRLSS